MAEHTLATAENKVSPAAAAVEKHASEQESEPIHERLSSLSIQCKLVVGAADDPMEDEADRMADTVMRMPDPALKGGTDTIQRQPISSFLQRKCALCEQEEKQVQRKETEGGTGETKASASLERYISKLDHSGSAIPEQTRSFFESRMGYDFSGVRVHTDGGARESATSINALAYTVGNNIVFNASQYQPGTESGKRLIAHELTHVVQQNNKIGRKIQRFTAGCRSMLNNPVGSLGRVLSGTAIHAAIQADFASSVSGGVNAFGIPGASAAALRTAGLCGEDILTTAPQLIGGRAGMGYPDLARRDGAVMEVAEIKPASWGCAVDGVSQLEGYISHGNATDPPQVAWRAAGGFASVIPMLSSTYPAKTLTIGTYTVMIEWCSPGLLVYQVIGSSLPLPVPVTSPARQRSRGRSPVLVREQSAWEAIRQFAEEAIRTGQTSAQAIENFLRAHPDLITVIIVAGIAGLIATFAEDIATAGAGILDDLVTVPFFARMISIALELRQSLALATAATAAATAQ